MRGAALLLPIAIALVTAIALAQGANDPLVQLRACSLMEGADRMECLDRLLRAAASPAHPALGWVISQTTSPVDYAPIATATTSSHKLADGSALQLSIRCRGGRTDLALIGPAVSGRADDYSISYKLGGGQPVQLASAAPAFGDRVAFTGDVVGLLQSLPGEGELAVHLSPRLGTALDAVFSLAGLEVVRAKIEAACKWPHAISKPND